MHVFDVMHTHTRDQSKRLKPSHSSKSVMPASFLHKAGAVSRWMGRVSKVLILGYDTQVITCRSYNIKEECH
jgi:hypothetical protein